MTAARFDPTRAEKVARDPETQKYLHEAHYLDIIEELLRRRWTGETFRASFGDPDENGYAVIEAWLKDTIENDPDADVQARAGRVLATVTA